MLDSVKRIAHDGFKAGKSFAGASKSFQSAYKGATSAPTPQLVVKPK